MNKKAILGSLTTTFIVTLLIVLILIVYGLASGVVKSVDFSGNTQIKGLGRPNGGYLLVNKIYMDLNRVISSEYAINRDSF